MIPTQPIPGPDGVARQAGLSGDKVYRWWLTRRWAAEGSWVHFVMLNPSTADGQTDDATIRRVTRFARDWGHSGVVITNLFSYRATDPAKLRAAVRDHGLHYVVGMSKVSYQTDDVIKHAAGLSAYTVCAWGAGATFGRANTVEYILRQAGVDLRVLRLSRKGAPWHPLYLPADTRPVAWTVTP